MVRMSSSAIFALLAFFLLTTVKPADACRSGNSCCTRFKGKLRYFKGCKEIADSPIRLHWRVNSKRGLLIALIVAKHDGYAAVGLGFSNMVGSEVFAVYSTNDTHADVQRYQISYKGSSGVTPHKILPRSSSRATIETVNGEKVMKALFYRRLSSTQYTLRVGEENNLIWSFGNRPVVPPYLSYHLGRGVDSFTP